MRANMQTIVAGLAMGVGLMLGVAGTSDARVSLGPQVGFALNNYIYGGSATPPTRSFTPGFTGGVDLQLDGLGAGLDVSAVFDMQGAKFDDAAVTFHNNYITMPILLKLNLVDSPVQLSLRVGPTVGLLVGATASSATASQSVDSTFHDFLLSAVGGVGLQFPLARGVRLDILARTQISLLRVDNFTDDQPVRNLSLQILVTPLFELVR